MNVTVFGVFDLLHEGHQVFLQQAAAIGDTLTVITPLDATVEQLKGQLPEQDFATRKSQLEAVNAVTTVLAGDTHLGSYQSLRKANPDLIYLGYDQRDLEESLRDFLQEEQLDIPIKIGISHDPDRYKTSILRQQL
jgi:FAD synthetase